MFCSQCGKKVRENMLFCPFCGAEIVIPEQDEPEETAAPMEAEPEPAGDAPEESRTEAPAAGEYAFNPDWRAEEPDWLRDEEEEPGDTAGAPLDIPDPPEPPKPRPPKLNAERPPRASGSALKKDVRAAGERHYTGGMPAAAPGDLFMDGAALDDDEDEFDRLDDGFDPPRQKEAEEAYEDPDEPGFLLRHLRSVVGLALFLILGIVVSIYAFSGPGQRALAKANLAWRPEVYSRLGRESYEAGQYARAGLYYERALSRRPDNYNYASSAAKCYIDAELTERAAEMLKRCIQLQPDDANAYIYLLGLYPDAVNRPLEVTQLIAEGYRRTGNARLRLEGSAAA